MSLPVAGFPISAETVREWFRRTYAREPTEREVGDVLDDLARRDATPPKNGELPNEQNDE